ncbi:Speckle-type POZ protein-like isoform X2 [Aphelenchoides fujianensis]|nr:Speckle-type POZ protein-like isoform X2 [Aphelenchoides fujianensis]
MATCTKDLIRWQLSDFARRLDAARPGDQWASDLFAFTDPRFGRVDFYLRFDPRGLVQYEGRTSAFHVQFYDGNPDLRLQLKCTAWLEKVDGTRSRTSSATLDFTGVDMEGWEAFLSSEELAPFAGSPTVFLCCRLSVDVEKIGELTDETTAFQWEIPELAERSEAAAFKTHWRSPTFHVEEFGKAAVFRLWAFPAGLLEEQDDGFGIFVAAENLGGHSRLSVQHSVWLENAKGETTPKFAGNQVYNGADYSGWTTYMKVGDVRRFAGDGALLVRCAIRPIGRATTRTVVSPLRRAIAATFDDEKYADLEVSCKERTFKVSKAVVLPQSPVFDAMFSHETAEKRTSSITIKDARPVDVERMLRFMYAGEVDDLPAAAFDLLPLADRYHVAELTDQCVEAIVAGLTAENAVAAFRLAATHDHLHDFLPRVSAFLAALPDDPRLDAELLAIGRQHSELLEALRAVRADRM